MVLDRVFNTGPVVVHCLFSDCFMGEMFSKSMSIMVHQWIFHGHGLQSEHILICWESVSWKLYQP